MQNRVRALCQEAVATQGHLAKGTGNVSPGAGQVRQEFHAVTPVSLPQQPGHGWESSPERTYIE